jgi:putative transcriptional regulator
MPGETQKTLYEHLKLALEDCLAESRGELTLRTVELPDEPPEIDGPTLVALRKRAAMSQAVFARMLNVSAKTMQSWERGSRRPSDASRRLLQVFSEQPAMLCRIVGLPEVQLSGVTIATHANGRRSIVVAPRRRSQRGKHELSA